ncbi:GntR family transcriptional regulator [Amycolatopsis benzoatilytica]|uniref:GntR family transcriptional regulator n=1 Tax=Amycolatopsis benzoatilytica TaxID=346045 RepID=UPI00036E4CF2|nr:GntR family transcriptional regulator [Amycolatopsis benzoatilytica]
MVEHTSPDRRGRTALKRQEIAAELRAEIVAGRYGNGALLPGENELAQRFGVSRGTIRRALGSLAEEDLIDTQTGVGSFVTFDGQPLGAEPSWGHAFAVLGAPVRAEIVRAQLVVDPELAASVASAGMEFLALDRVRRLADGTPVSLERSRVPAVGRIADVPLEGLVGNSLTATMAEAGLSSARGEQWIAVAPLEPADAELLGRRPDDAFLHAVRISYTADGRFAEKVTSWLDPKRFRLHTKFGGGR